MCFKVLSSLLEKAGTPFLVFFIVFYCLYVNLLGLATLKVTLSLLGYSCRRFSFVVVPRPVLHLKCVLPAPPTWIW